MASEQVDSRRLRIFSNRRFGKFIYRFFEIGDYLKLFSHIFRVGMHLNNVENTLQTLKGAKSG